MPDKHLHYALYNDDDGYYINRYVVLEGESFARRETVYSGIQDEEQAVELEHILKKNEDYLHN